MIQPPKLSIIIPAFNEEKTIRKAVSRLFAQPLGVRFEVIVINDGSTDKTRRNLDSWKKSENFTLISHPKNLGKGRAIVTGLKHATGELILIQDADLEYDPKFIPDLLKAHKRRGSVIYGSRLTEPPILFGAKRTPFLIHYFGNRFLSLVTSLLYGCFLTDIETGYKLFPRTALSFRAIKSHGFEIEAELTGKLLRKRYKIEEIPIETVPRSYAQGKKIRAFRDGFRAFLTLVRFRFEKI